MDLSGVWGGLRVGWGCIVMSLVGIVVVSLSALLVIMFNVIGIGKVIIASSSSSMEIVHFSIIVIGKGGSASGLGVVLSVIVQ